MEILPNVPVFAKIKVKSLPSPCVFSLSYTNRGQLMAYASVKHKLPDENLHEVAKENPRRITVHAPIKKKDRNPHDQVHFECDHIYLKLES